MKIQNIMIVEDEAILAMDLQHFLKREGYNVEGVFADGNRAIDFFVSSGNLDLVITDIYLSGELDGIEMAKVIMRRSNVPVIFITGYRDFLTISKLTEINPAAIIFKPIHSHDIIRHIHNLSVSL